MATKKEKTKKEIVEEKFKQAKEKEQVLNQWETVHVRVAKEEQVL